MLDREPFLYRINGLIKLRHAVPNISIRFFAESFLAHLIPERVVGLKLQPEQGWVCDGDGAYSAIVICVNTLPELLLFFGRFALEEEPLA
jgi:hypothetical protein